MSLAQFLQETIVCRSAASKHAIAKPMIGGRIAANRKGRNSMLAAEQELEHLGETQGCADHDHDLVHELSRRLDMLWRYDQYIANADWRKNLKQFWSDMKAQELQNVERLKKLIKEEIDKNCF